MATYQYRAVNKAGRVYTGTLDATTEHEVENQLKILELDLIFAHEYRPLFPKLSQRRITRRDLANMCFHLEQQTKAGVPLMDGLRDLRDSVDNPALKQVTSSLIDKIEAGASLSVAMADFPRAFDSVFVNLIRAGEKSGKLVEVLNSLSETLKWQDEIASQMKKALTYPIFVGFAVAGVVIALMVFLVPELVKFITSMNQKLPIHTRALIATSDALRDYGGYLFLVLVAMISTHFIAFHRSEAYRFRIDSIKLNMWPTGPVLRKLLLARFAHYFALLYSAGITVPECLKICADIMGNRVLSRAVSEAAKTISEGKQLAASFELTGLFPRLVVRMLKVGETTGGLDTALTNVGYFFNRDVRDAIDRMQSMIGPAMTVVLGIVLGWVILSVFGPIYDAISTVKM